MFTNSIRAKGFTLIELIVTLTVAGVVLGIAIPSFSAMMASNRLTAYSNQLVAALNMARSEAIKRGVQVNVERKGNTGQAWENGWVVYIDSDASNAYNANADTLLKTYDALPSGYTLRTGGNFTCWVAFTSNGLNKGSGTACTGSGAATDTFRLCDSSADKTKSRAITINMIGRATIATGTNSCP